MIRPVIFIALVVVSIVLGSLLPINFGNYDKILHLGTYGFLLFSLCWGFPKYRYTWVVVALSIGIGMEILQSFELLGHREFSYKDIIANSLGVSAGLLCLFIKDKLSINTLLGKIMPRWRTADGSYETKKISWN